MSKKLLERKSPAPDATTERLLAACLAIDEAELDLAPEGGTWQADIDALLDSDATRCIRPRDGSADAPPGAIVLQRVEGYEILEELGRGGMGVVYKAWQHSLQRSVALKMVLAGSFAGAEELLRFRAEAMAIARLHHPHLLNIFEIGACESLPFYAMEYMEGGSLSRRLNGQPIDPRVAAGLLRSLAQAMDYAHKNGIVHRDLKPANILLSGSSDTPLADCVAKITDFGIAKHLNQDSTVTRTGDILGTPHYMAPEQALGRSTLIGPAADIYSLGAILYEMLTGRPPFHGHSGADVILRLSREEPERPSHWMRTVPRDLETICLKCLEKDPARRYASAVALADDLERFLQGEAIRARPASLVDRGIKWTRRRPALASVLLMTAILVALGFTMMAVVMQQAVERAVLNDVLLDQTRETARLKDDMLTQSKELLADAYLERGIHLAERGDVRRGMHWMLRSLQMTEELEHRRNESSELGSIIRMNLSSWGQCVSSREASLPHTDWVWDVAFSPDQKLIATASKDTRVQLWHAQTTRAAGTALAHPHPVWGVAFHPDGQTLFTVCGDYSKRNAGQLRAWSANPNGFVPRGAPVEFPYSVGRLLVHPNGDRIWVAGPDGTASLFAFDPKAVGNGLTLIKTLFDEHHQLCGFTSDGALLATIIGTPLEQPPYFLPTTKVSLHDARTGEFLCEPFEHPGVVRTAFFSKDGKHLIAGSAAHSDPNQVESSLLYVWDIAQHKHVTTSAPMIGRIKASTLASSGQLFAVSVFQYSKSNDGKISQITDGSIGLWQLNDEGQIEQMGAPLRTGHVVWSMAFSPDSRMLLAGCENAGAFLWSVSNGQQLRNPLWHEGNCVKVLFSNDGRTAVTASAGGGVTVSARVWDVPRFAHIGPPLIQPAGIRSAYWEKDGAHAWIGCWHHLSSWDHQRGAVSETIAMPQRVVYYHPTNDKRCFLADLGDQRLGEFDRAAHSIKLMADLKPAERGSGFDYHAETDTILQYWSLPSKFRILDRTGKDLTPTVSDPQHELSARQLSPRGDVLVVAQTVKLHTNRVMIYNARDLTLRHEINVKHEVKALAFTPDGKTLALGGRDRQVQFLDVESGQFVGSPLLHEGIVQWIGYLASDRLLATHSEKGHILLWDVKTGKRVGPAFEVRADLMSINVHPQGKYLLTATSGKMAMTWRIPEPVEGSLEQIRLWVETMTGMEMNSHDAIIPLDGDRLQERRQRLAALRQN